MCFYRLVGVGELCQFSQRVALQEMQARSKMQNKFGFGCKLATKQVVALQIFIFSLGLLIG